jgi:hypothetical protein
MSKGNTFETDLLAQSQSRGLPRPWPTSPLWSGRLNV